MKFTRYILPLMRFLLNLNLLIFVEFRLDVSGGNKHSMGSIGMNYVSSFLDEIFLYKNMMDNWNGEYRGNLRLE